MIRLMTPRRLTRAAAVRPALFAVTTVWMAMLLAVPANAGSGSILSLPQPGVKVTTGLSLTIDTEWLDGNGYRPVTISVSPFGGVAAPADRTVDVTLRPHSRQWSVVMPSVSTSITLEQGQTVVTKVISVPQSQAWGSVEVVTYEDGRRRDDLSQSLGINWNANAVWSEAAPTILFVDSDARTGGRGSRFVIGVPMTGTSTAGTKKEKKPDKLPDFRHLAMLFLTENYGNNLAVAGVNPSEDIDDSGLLRLASVLNRFEIVRPDRLPTEWLQLTAVDIIFVSMLDLQLVNRNPAAWEALRTWLSTGTTLCVYDVGEEFSSIPELERLFEIAVPSAPDLGSSVSDFIERGWRAPRVADYTSEVSATRNAQWSNQQNYPGLIVAATPTKKKSSNRRPDNPKPFLIRQVEYGNLVAFSDENPFPGTSEEWCWMFNTLSNQDWMWYQRHGMSFNRENPQYWNLLIPGVGDAPVNSFLVLISLFVIVIGPVNYFMLQRRRKLFLLLLTVPVGAGIVTAALFSYALINDGLGVRVRARSLTRIDQTNGRTVSWSRQSYYAGLAPSAGMSFPADAAIYPIDHRPTGRYGQPKSLGRRIRWGGEQRLTQGYLNSRSTSQVIVIESRDTGLGIDVDDSVVGSTTPVVTNRLGVDVEQLVICSSDGRSLACGKLPAGQAVQLHAIDENEFPIRWNKLFAAQRPQFPIGFDPNQIENVSAIFGNSYSWWQQVDRGLPEPSMATSVLERGLRNVGNLKLGAMQPRSYIAIVRQAPNVSLGIESVAEESSFHVVTGRW